MPPLDAQYQDVGIKKNRHPSVSLIDILAADALKGEHRKMRRKAPGPSLKRRCFLSTSERTGFAELGGYRCLVLKNVLDVTLKRLPA